MIRAFGQDRRTFLKDMATAGGAFLLAGSTGSLMAQSASSRDWKRQMGLELYTVRDLMERDFEGTLEKVAAIGYKEVEPTSYGVFDPKQFRTLLDRYGLTAPSTHAGATDGPDLDKQLEGFQIMGIQYTEINTPRPARSAPTQRRRQTEESVKRTAEQINKHGEIARKFGMKMLIHNHTHEFELLEGGKLTAYDVLLAETDPSLVAMQLDIGWASVAGQNIIRMFHKNPGRFELWHVKDAVGIKSMDPSMTMSQRQRAAYLVPVGQGEIDYKTIFANAKLAGLKHFAIEQDNAAAWGDSMAAAKTSYQDLMKILS